MLWPVGQMVNAVVCGIAWLPEPVEQGLFKVQEMVNSLRHTSPTRKRGKVIARPSLARRASVGS
jgi:hypothetical protein